MDTHRSIPGRFRLARADRGPDKGDDPADSQSEEAARAVPPNAGRSAEPRLPAQPRRLIGCERALQQTRALLLQTGTRLLTLFGPPGVGKTRLGLALAESAADQFPDGAFFVPLATARTPEQVLAAISRALGAHQARRRTTLERVQHSLGRRQVLLVLDNFEQVLAAAGALSAMLESCPSLKVVVTSRAALRIRWERLYPVSPLAARDPARRRGGQMPLESPAIALFVERVREVQPEFRLTEDNAGTIATICRRLDGLPLALEIAAARAAVLSPSSILKLLDRGLSVLSGGARDLPTRQQTLRDAIAWSYDLLDSREQAVFRRLAVFVDGSTLDAAEAVCSPELGDRLDVLEAVQLLADHSLVRLKREPDGEVRLGLLETIRAFARELLEASGEIRDARERQARVMLALAERAEPSLRAADQRVWLERLGREQENLAAALIWCLEHRQAEAGLRLGAALWRFWSARARHVEGRRWLAALLDLDPTPSAVRGEATFAAGRLALEQGDFEDAGRLFDESLAIALATSDRESIAAAYTQLGHLAACKGDLVDADSLHRQALAIRRLTGARRERAISLQALGEIAWLRGDLMQASEQTREAMETFLELGDDQQAGRGLLLLGLTIQDGGDPRRALELLRESLHLFQSLGDLAGVADALDGLVVLASTQSDPSAVLRVAAAAAAARAQIGSVAPLTWRTRVHDAVARASRTLGEAIWEPGRPLSATEALAEVEDAFRPNGGHPNGGHPNGGRLERLKPMDQPMPLTSRQLDVAILIARGYTNQQIAEALVIAKLTADKHVANILARLDLASRAQVAAWTVQHGLLDDSVGEGSVGLPRL